MEVWGLTDPGLVRSQNQDYYLTMQLGKAALACVVCDGMGGAKSGNVASKLAAEVFFDELKRSFRPDLEADRVENLLLTAVTIANTAVYENSLLSPDMNGMGTTLVAGLFLGKKVYVANVGDSRAYYLNRDGVRRITVDHSLVELMVQRGELTPEQAKNYPGKNLITRAVGTEPTIECDVFTQDLKSGDCILLCTDGLTNQLADQELLFEVVHGVHKADCCRRLINIARDRGAPDNVTAVLVAF